MQQPKLLYPKLASKIRSINATYEERLSLGQLYQQVDQMYDRCLEAYQIVRRYIKGRNSGKLDQNTLDQLAGQFIYNCYEPVVSEYRDIEASCNDYYTWSPSDQSEQVLEIMIRLEKEAVHLYQEIESAQAVFD